MNKELIEHIKECLAEDVRNTNISCKPGDYVITIEYSILDECGNMKCTVFYGTDNSSNRRNDV